MRYTVRFAVAALVSALAVSSAQANTIFGHVYDHDGVPLDGVAVKIRAQTAGSTCTTSGLGYNDCQVTGAGGQFTFWLSDNLNESIRWCVIADAYGGSGTCTGIIPPCWTDPDNVSHAAVSVVTSVDIPAHTTGVAYGANLAFVYNQPCPAGGGEDDGGGFIIPIHHSRTLSIGVNRNPVSGRAMLNYYMPKAGLATIEAFDVTGRRVATIQSSSQSAGQHTASWDVGSLSKGIYLVRLRVGGSSAQTRALVMR